MYIYINYRITHRKNMSISCDTKGKITKKKIAVLSSAALGIATIAYLAFTLTHNPTIAATVPAFLSFAACPAMCMGMCGVFFLVNRLANKNKRKTQMLEGKVVENEGSFS